MAESNVWLFTGRDKRMKEKDCLIKINKNQVRLFLLLHDINELVIRGQKVTGIDQIEAALSAWNISHYTFTLPSRLELLGGVRVSSQRE